MAISSATNQMGRPSMTVLGAHKRSTRRPWIVGTPAAAWTGIALLTALWPDQPATDWDYTGELAAAFGALGAVLACAALADHWFACPPRIRRVAPWMLALALLLGAWETVTAKLGLLPMPFFPPPQALLEVVVDDWARLAEGVLASLRLPAAGYFRLVGLDGFATAYPRQLSGGMSQRAALARALVNDPKLLILDEPLGQLDSLTRISMQEELVSLWQRADFTALLVTHDVEEAVFLANRVIVLSERPARITAEVVNARPYPRHRGDPHLAELRRDIMGHLGLAERW